MRVVPIRNLTMIPVVRPTLSWPVRLVAYALLVAVGLAVVAVVVCVVTVIAVVRISIALAQVVRDRRQVHPGQAMMYPRTPTQEEP